MPDEKVRIWKSRLIEACPGLCRLVPAAAIFCLAAWCALSIHHDFAWDDADSEILNQAWVLAKGESIYRSPDVPPFVFAIYPPLYIAAVAVLMKFTGLSFIPAELLSFFAALSIGWAMVRLNRNWNRIGQGGLWATFFLFLIPAFLYNSVRSHVQMMAVAFSVWSLVFFLRNRLSATVIISPLLAVLAIYTKQTQIALPLAMTIYLAIRNRRWLLPYLATFALAGLIPFLWLQGITNGYFFRDIVRLAILTYNAFIIPFIFLHHAGPVLVFICLALTICWRRFRNGDWEAIDCYLVCVLAITLISLGRPGAHGQYVLELLVVTLLFLLRTTGLPAIQGRDALVSIQILFLFIYTTLFIFVEEGVGTISANRAARKIYPLLRTQPGPILSQQGSFALFSHGEIFVQLFHFTGLSRAGLWDQRHLLEKIGNHTFSWVITEFSLENPNLSADDKERFTPELIEALQNNYQRREVIYPYYLYRPRQ
jgi:hypothetical protein